jgi:hypothetical protein
MWTSRNVLGAFHVISEALTKNMPESAIRPTVSANSDWQTSGACCSFFGLRDARFFMATAPDTSVVGQHGSAGVSNYMN